MVRRTTTLCVDCQQYGHSRSQSFYRLYRACVYFKGLHIVAACLFSGLPSGKTAQRTDVIDAEFDTFSVEGGNAGLECTAHFESGHQVFPDIQDYVYIIHHNQTHNRGTRSDQFAAFGKDSGYLPVFGSGESGVYQEGGDFIDSTAAGIYKTRAAARSSLCAPSTAI